MSTRGARYPLWVRKLSCRPENLGIDGTNLVLTGKRRKCCRMTTRTPGTRNRVRTTRIRCIYVRTEQGTRQSLLLSGDQANVRRDPGSDRQMSGKPGESADYDYDDGGRHRSGCCLRTSCMWGERAAARWWRLRRTRWPTDGDSRGHQHAWDDVRWPAVAATLRSRGRVCAAQVGRTRLHRMASAVVFN